MTEQTPSETFNLDGEEYSVADLNPDGQYLIRQIKDLQAQKSRLTGNLHQVEVAMKGFTDLLQEELKETSED